MSLALYMDHHVPAAVTDGLRQRGVDVLTAQEDGTADWDDDSLLTRTSDLGRVLFSMDDDLLALAHRKLEEGQDFSGLIYSHQLRITIGRAVLDLEYVSRVLEPQEMQNQILFLPLR